jgi:hypothetical protein
VERRRLALQYRKEIRARTDAYRSDYAQALLRAGGGRLTRAARAHPPLRLLAEGDSWFDYPVPLFGGGVIDRLARRLGLPILNLAQAGDEVRYMLGVEQRRKLAQLLERGAPGGGRWDAVLFSGGGNDIVDHPMALWVVPFDPDRPPADHVHPVRFPAALALVRAGYEDLIALRDRLSPTTRLFFHGYDFAIPDGRGVCHYGPWLRPTFDLHGFPRNGAVAWEVVKAMLERFAGMLRELAQRHGGITVVPTQGTLEYARSSWHNELHPSKTGFERIADVFATALRAEVPGRGL